MNEADIPRAPGAQARVLVAIPAFNEGGIIGGVVRGVRAAAAPVVADVLVVDDGSSDATAREARDAGARVVSLVQNLGYGNALQTAYRVALADGYDILVQMDGDGQHAPNSIAGLLAPVLAGECDFALGSRALAAAPYPMPFARRAGQRLFSALLRIMGGPAIRDITSGFQAMNRRTLELFVSPDYPGDYPDADVLLFLAYRGITVREVAADFRPAPRAKSMHAGILKPAYYIYKMSFSMLLVALRHRHAPRPPGGTP
jgi:glycosyltransferase involved in cell wall biosynthesis